VIFKCAQYANWVKLLSQNLLRLESNLVQVCMYVIRWISTEKLHREMSFVFVKPHVPKPNVRHVYWVMASKTNCALPCALENYKKRQEGNPDSSCAQTIYTVQKQFVIYYIPLFHRLSDGLCEMIVSSAHYLSNVFNYSECKWQRRPFVIHYTDYVALCTIKRCYIGFTVRCKS